MEYVGFDLGKVNSQICLITEDGELIDFIDVTLKDVQVMENAILAGLKK